MIYKIRFPIVIGTHADNIDSRVIDHRMGFIKNVDKRKHILIIIGAGGLGVAFWGVLDWLVPPSIHYESMPQSRLSGARVHMHFWEE